MLSLHELCESGVLDVAFENFASTLDGPVHVIGADQQEEQSRLHVQGRVDVSPPVTKGYA